ncbi:uncharacterized protein [Palaemon carinicauda]|uniref:uncharacterized protein n=1 Tax=Palaemon carinicauda TaxID=392227 RepID=UPI0035B69CA7
MYADDSFSDCENGENSDFENVWTKSDVSRQDITDGKLELPTGISWDGHSSDADTSSTGGNVNGLPVRSSYYGISSTDLDPEKAMEFKPCLDVNEIQNKGKGNEVGSFQNIRLGSIYPNSARTLQDLQKSPFSLALLNQFSKPSEDDSSSRYSRALQLLKEKENQELIASGSPLRYEGRIDVDGESSQEKYFYPENEDLYEHISNVIKQECNKERDFTSDNFTTDSENDDDSSESLTFHDSGDLTSNTDHDTVKITRLSHNDKIEKEAPNVECFRNIADSSIGDNFCVGNFTENEAVKVDRLRSKIDSSKMVDLSVSNYMEEESSKFESYSCNGDSRLITDSAKNIDSIGKTTIAELLKSNENLGNVTQLSHRKYDIEKIQSDDIFRNSVDLSRVTSASMNTDIKREDSTDNFDITRLDSSEVILKNDSHFEKLKNQVSIFHMRVKVFNKAHELLESWNHEISSCLETYLERIIKSSHCYKDITDEIFCLKKALEENTALTSWFLYHFLSYVQSVIDLESSVAGLNEFFADFHSCLSVAVEGDLETKVIEGIKQDGIMPLLFCTLQKMIADETEVTHRSMGEILEFTRGNIVKAHVVRMQATESQKLFQETFSDRGNPTELYVIYIWRILKIYSIEQRNGLETPSVVCLSDILEESGRFVSIIPVKVLREKESKIQFSTMKRSSLVSQKSAVTKDELTVEWADFRIGQVYGNGVVFLTNMCNWVEKVKEISRGVCELEVKKYIKFFPSLGSTYGLELKEGLKLLNKTEDVTYIRVRVVRVAGPLARVYGIDTGIVLAIEVDKLIFLPASLLNIPPCGRLAHLPVVPAPNADTVVPTLKVLVSLAYRKIFAQELASVDGSCLILWMQVPKLTLHVLHFLKKLLNVSSGTPLIYDICTAVTDYLLRVSCKQEKEFSCIHKALTLLISAMEISPKIRHFLAKEGAFVTLCDLGLKVGNLQIWNFLRVLIGGKEAMESCLADTNKLSLMHNRRNFKPWKLEAELEKTSGNNISSDTSPAILKIASLTSIDRNWDLEIRGTLRTRQLVPYSNFSGWSWKKQEVLTANVETFHYGHRVDVKNDETHHIILDKSVANIRMNTLLQIVLGMLNTSLGGKIYIGLNHVGIVQGVKMTRDQRDCLMLGFSKLVTSEIFPMVLPCDSFIQFVKVVRAGALPPSVHADDSGLTSLNSEATFVVIITVRPLPNTLYRYRCDPDTVFIREGGITSTIKMQNSAQLRNTISSRNQTLQREVCQEKKALLKLILSK